MTSFFFREQNAKKDYQKENHEDFLKLKSFALQGINEKYFQTENAQMNT